MRIEKTSPVLAFDNMQDRVIQDTTRRKTYEVALDGPHATGIFFGVPSEQERAVWLHSVSFEAVRSSLPIRDGSSGMDRPT